MNSITMFRFIISFIVAKQCLVYVKGLTVSLQKKAKDICLAYREVTSVVTAIIELRQNIDVKHIEWFDVAVGLGQTVNVSEPQLPRRCNIQRGRVIHQEILQRFIIGVKFLFLFLMSSYPT